MAVVRRRLSNGMHRLDAWSGGASQIEREAVYDALFAVSNGSVSRAYGVATAGGTNRDFLVLVRDNLIIRIRMHTAETFGIEYIGPPDTAHGGARAA